MTIWHILCSFGTLLPVFGILYQEKSGNPGQYSAVLTSFWRHFLEHNLFFEFCLQISRAAPGADDERRRKNGDV
jgi:hypothetical protein